MAFPLSLSMLSSQIENVNMQCYLATNDLQLQWQKEASPCTEPVGLLAGARLKVRETFLCIDKEIYQSAKMRQWKNKTLCGKPDAENPK
jgi:hypothetical protein